MSMFDALQFATIPAEDEALRKVQDRTQSRRPPPERARRDTDRRRAERAVAEAESDVTTWEVRVESVRAALEDPALYLAPDGARRASELGRELEEARRGLEAAFARWESATRAAETA